MTWTSGLATVSANGAARDMRDLIEGALTAHGGYVLVEEHSGWRVWRSPVALNGVRDWYLFIRIATAGHLVIFMAEDYNETTHQFCRAGYTYGSNNAVASGSWDAATQSPLGATWYTLNNSESHTYAIAHTGSGAPTSTFDYQIRVGTKHLMYSFTWGGGQYGAWRGFFDTLIANPADDPVPLGFFDLWNPNGGISSSNGGNTWGTSTRMPLPFTHTTWNGANQAHGGLADIGALVNVGAGTSGARAQYNALGGSTDAWGAPALVGPKYFVQDAQSAVDSRRLRLRGVVPGMVAAGAGSGLYLNDEFVLDGVTYAVSSYAVTTTCVAVDKAFAA